MAQLEVLLPRLFRDGIVELTNVNGALVEFVPVVDCSGHRKLPALNARTDRHAAKWWPGIGEDAVNVVERIYFPMIAGMLIGHVFSRNFPRANVLALWQLHRILNQAR